MPPDAESLSTLFPSVLSGASKDEEEGGDGKTRKGVRIALWETGSWGWRGGSWVGSSSEEILPVTEMAAGRRVSEQLGLRLPPV